MQTTARGVVEQLCLSEQARAEYRSWRQQRPAVADHVLAHTTRVAYEIDLTALRQVASITEHALGEANRKRAESVQAIRDWNPRFAFTHVLHYALEAKGEAFTYQWFRYFCEHDGNARLMLWEPAKDAVDRAAATTCDARQAREAMRWRIGNSYYSFLRELVVLAVLRESGLFLQTHPLADALFRVDAWSGQTAVSLYVGNRRYRDDSAGRKKQTSALLGPDFRYVAINMPTQHEFGRLHVPRMDSIAAASKQISRAGGPAGRS